MGVIMAEIPLIRRIVDSVCIDWQGVMSKRMFGTDAWFVHGNIFSIIDTAKQSIGLRFTEPMLHNEARALKGSSDFAPGGEPMKHWVIMPPALSADEAKLEPYLKIAYQLASILPPKILKSKGRPMG
jgi:hypothetical protein